MGRRAHALLQSKTMAKKQKKKKKKQGQEGQQTEFGEEIEETGSPSNRDGTESPTAAAGSNSPRSPAADADDGDKTGVVIRNPLLGKGDMWTQERMESLGAEGDGDDQAQIGVKSERNDSEPLLKTSTTCFSPN
eukprot:SAG31_NODE_4175_length_3507_cov_2.044894_1_plen_134_part_00